jgi:hypothetical protein
VQGTSALHAHRPGEVEPGEYLRVPEDFGGPAQVAEHEADFVARPEQRLAMRASAEVEKLAGARLAGHEADRAADEGPIVADDARDVGQRGEQPLRGLPVGGEVVLPPRM